MRGISAIRKTDSAKIPNDTMYTLKRNNNTEKIIEFKWVNIIVKLKFEKLELVLATILLPIFLNFQTLVLLLAMDTVRISVWLLLFTSGVALGKFLTLKIMC